MQKYIIFCCCLLIGISFALEFPSCTGITINQQYTNGTNFTVYSHNFNININLNKDYPDKSELIFSNFSYWSINDTVYQPKNISLICDAYPNCFYWDPLNGTMIKEFVFKAYQIVPYISTDTDKGVQLYFRYIFDKRLIYNGEFLFDPILQNCDIDSSLKYEICCNNYINYTIPEEAPNEICVDFKTIASVNFNSAKLWHYEANYSVANDQLSIDKQHFTFFSDFYSLGNIVNFHNERDFNLSKTMFYTFLLSTALYEGDQQDQFQMTRVSVLRTINGVMMTDDFEVFTPANPCWNAPTPYWNSSMSLNASLCCVQFATIPTTLEIQTTMSTAVSELSTFSQGIGTNRKFKNTKNLIVLFTALLFKEKFFL